MSEYGAKFELTGTSSLLMHHDNIDGGDLLKDWRQSPKNKNQSVPGDDRSPPWTWTTYLYTDGAHVAIPQENVMGALLYGGTQVILKKQKTYKELSQSGILIPKEYLNFTFGGKRLAWSDVEAMRDLPFSQQAKECQRLGFCLFAKRARVGQSKHIRIRPRFANWKISGELEVRSPDLPFDRLVEIFGYAGKAGIGDWRPSSPKRPGPYGMFTSQVTRI